MSRDEDLNGATALSERWSAARNRMERQDRAHGRVEGRGPRSPSGREVEHRRRWPRRFAGSWWRAPGRSRLPDRFLSLLGKGARAKGLRVWTIRRELHGGGFAGRRGLHRRPLSDWERAVRSDAAPR